MIKILCLFLFFIPLFGYELQENYEFERDVIFSNDLFPDLPSKFEILKIPADKSQYRIDANVIAKTFELNGIAVETDKVRYVNFTRHSPVDFTAIKDQLHRILLECYPSMQIDEISIHPRGYIASIGKDTRGYFDNRTCQNNNGLFYILDLQGLRHYLDYTVQGNLEVLHTIQKVLRKEPITGFNTILKSVPFQSFKDKPLTTLPDIPSRYRSNLKASQLLTIRNIEPSPLVLKNEKVVVEVRNGAVIVEFIATATQEGSLYDIITVQKNDGKRAKAKVIGDNRVELQ